LKIIQDFDPAGVGARNLQECLYLQLCRKTPTELVNLEMRIVQDNFEDFQKMNTRVLLKKLDCSEEQLEAALKDLSKLNPKPGNSSSNIYDRVETIIPDFILEEIDGDLVLSLNNGNVPELRVCRKYKDMINDYTSNKEGNKKNKDAVMYIKQKLDSANWFIDAIKQRNETMMTVMQTIVDIQSDYFHSGDDMLLKPMILQTVADRAGCDPTTVSRVTKGKYIQTEFGIIPLKYFFVDSLHAGEGMSTINIKERIRQLLEDENPDKMLRDDEIADILQKEGVVASFSASWVNPSTRLVNNTIYVIIGVVGIIMLSYESQLLPLFAVMSIGRLSSFLSYTNQYTKPFNEISNVTNEYEAAKASFRRINDFLNIDDDINEGNEEINDINTITFKNMSFSYDRSKKLIENFSLNIKKGQKVAIVGPTGAGKTTLINLLMRFYDCI